MKIKSFFKDWFGIVRIMKNRENSINKANDKKEKKMPEINKVAKLLHPGIIRVKLINIESSSNNSKTFRFVKASNTPIPYFEAGQYMTIEVKIGESIITRPYSISSNPINALNKDDGFVEITIKETNGGIVSNYMLNTAKVGDEFNANIGLGQFYYEPLRDSDNVVLIAGGSGITPFISMASFLNSNTSTHLINTHITILYGVNKLSDIIKKDELDSLNSDKVRVIYVVRDEEVDGCEKGLINSDIIKKYMGLDPTFFVCGPRMMYKFISNEIDKLNIKDRRRRFEVFGENKNILLDPKYPLKEIKTFNIDVQIGTTEKRIISNSNESILTAFERAGIKIDNACRSGECGFCRIELISGNVYINEDEDNRRYYDKKYNYLHSCSSYPLSDLIVKIPIRDNE